ncbi:MAG: hypothetical protein MJ211_07870 [Bacteroidales bacterium]|nr:hypothetical protein [Bacteroidales bacterium]
MKKLLILCVLIFSNFINSFSQNFDSVYNIALFAFNNGDFDLAKKEIQRLLFFDTTNISPKKYLLASKIYFATEDYSQAEMFINTAYSLSKLKSQRDEILLTKADFHIFSKKYFNTIIELNLINLEGNSILQTEVYLRFAIAYFCLNDYEKSNLYFSKIISPDKYYDLQKLFKKTKNLKRPNSALIVCSSILFPGLGQYLTGNFWDGFSSEIILSSFTLLGIYLAQNYTNWTAILCVFPFLERYYLGGIKNAYQNSKLKHQSKSNKLLNSILELLSKN